MRRLLLVLALVLVPSVALAKPVPSCKSPRNAIEAVFLWQQGKQQSLANAAKCFERGGRTPRELEEAARRLKTVFDAEGAIVATEKLSDDPDYVDDDKNAHMVANARYPKVFVEKREGRWVWTRESLDWMDEHYEDRFGAFDRVIDAIPEPLCVMIGALAAWQYAALALLLVVGTLMARLLRGLVRVWMRHGQGSAEKEPSFGLRVLDRAAFPTSLAVSAVFVRLAYPELRLPVEYAAALHVGFRVMLTVAAILAALRFSDVFVDGLQKRAEHAESRLDDHLIPILRKSMKAACLLVGFLILLQNFHVDVTALFATLGIGTLAVGLGAKDALANLFGSISIFIDNPFKIGDWIHVDGTDGIVEEVGFRSTRLRTLYNSVVVIPNAKLADSKIDNYGKRTRRRFLFTLHLVHATSTESIERVTESLRALIAERPRIDPTELSVVLTGVGGPALELTVTCFFRSEADLDEPTEKHALLLSVLDRVHELGLSLYAPPAPTALPPVTDRR